MSSDVDPNRNGNGTSSSQDVFSIRSTLTREAVERANRASELATGLAAAEQELKQFSQASSNTGSEERDCVELGQRVEKELLRSRQASSAGTPSSSVVGPPGQEGQLCSPPSNRSSADSSKSGSGHSQPQAQGGDLRSADAHDPSHPALPLLEEQACVEEGGVASGSDNANGQGSLGQESLDRLSLSNHARARAELELNELRGVMATMTAEHKVLVHDLQAQLQQAPQGENEGGVDMIEPTMQVDATRATCIESLKEQLLLAQTHNRELRDEADQDEERLAILEARTQTRAERLLGEVNDQAMTLMSAEIALEAVRSKSGRQSQENAAMVREAKRLNGMLDVANNELQILHDMRYDSSQNEDESADRITPNRSDNSSEFTGSSASGQRPKPGVKHLEAALASHRESQRQMNDELTELRLQMSGMELGHEAQIGDLQCLLHQANQKLLNSSVAIPSNVARMQSPRRRAPASARTARLVGTSLSSIDEEDDIESIGVGSNSASANVSSNEDSDSESGHLGDLADLDEVVEAVSGQASRQSEIEPIRPQGQELMDHFWELREALAGKEAELNIRRRRVASLDQQEKDQLATLKQHMAGQSESHAQQVDALEKLLAAKDVDVADKDESYKALLEEKARREVNILTEVEEMKQDLFRALEAKRITCRRLEDIKRELESTHRRYETVIMDLKSELTKHEASGSAPSDADGGSSDWRERLQAALEDRNVLAHTLEWKEVQWKARLEHLELENKQLVADLKQQHSFEISKLQRKLDEQQTDFKQSREAWEQEKKELETRVSTNVVPSFAATANGWLQVLRCPTRMLLDPNVISQFSSSSSSSPSGALEAVYCQEVCWQVLGSVGGTIALMCDSPGLRIMQASARANMIWGSQNLLGHLVVSLLKLPASAAWLRRAILTHQTLAKMDGAAGDVPGFAIHTLGRLEFREGSHGSFESGVTVAHMPAEPRLGREATVIVIVEPPHQKDHDRRHTESRSEARSFAQDSVVSDDVQPGDSASNVMGNGTWYY